MSRRRLSNDERELWRGVIRSVKPLRQPAKPGQAEDEAVPVASTTKARPRPATVAAVSLTKPAAPPLAPLDRRARKRIARGRQPIDARLDLHGMTQAVAYDALLGFLRRTQSRGGRLVLVITGKGSGAADGRPGVLRRMVPQWLELSEFRNFVSGYERANVGHGGEGALYITVRKARR